MMRQDKQFLSINEVAAITGVGRTTIYAFIKKGDLKRVKVGRLTKIATDDFKKFTDGLKAGTA